MPMKITTAKPITGAMISCTRGLRTNKAINVIARKNRKNPRPAVLFSM